MARTIALEEHFTKELAAYAVGILSIACPECGRKRCDCRSLPLRLLTRRASREPQFPGRT